jgi:alcohol dehydrogenase (cytochrome c)/quinohemoprotein ethanol dehydrogenase
MMIARRSNVWLALMAGGCLTLAGCGGGSAEKPGVEAAQGVTGQLIAQGTDSDWLSNGRTYDEQRHSPLTDINRQNVKDLGLAWYSDLDTARGQESTPLVIDGVIYITTAWSKVRAYDAVTGKELWSLTRMCPATAG